LTQIAFSPDGQHIVYVRGGDHGGPGGGAPNPDQSPGRRAVQIWSVAASGGAPRLVGEGDEPAVAPDGKRVAFVREGRIWLGVIDGAAKPQAPFDVRGRARTPSWSPDGRTLAFVADRGDHSFIALYAQGRPVRYVAASTSRDSMPTWSPDGRLLAFLRQPGLGGTPRSPLIQLPQPWTVMVARFDGAGVETATAAVSSAGPAVERILQHPGGIDFRWAADDTLVFLAYRDGWPHLYSVKPDGRGDPQLLTPGPFMVEQLSLTPDGRFAVYSANTGARAEDRERRHLFKVPVDAPGPVPFTVGNGIEWSPAVLADGRTVALLAADPRRPPLPAVAPLDGGPVRIVAPDHVRPDFPAQDLVIPESVAVRASDGVEAPGQLFIPSGSNRHPAIVYVHGGGPRQMLLGWHYRWEYANDYGINQYLASRGFVVLAINYRLSVGYGEAFQFPEHAGPRGASEYLDVLAAGRYLQTRADVDPRRIGIWGASYGGYLTALALGRNSDVFAAGVDIHGVHDRTYAPSPQQFAHALVSDGITEADLRQAATVAFESSPISAVGTWRSPVLLIHGDDDRVVDFHQTVDLARRLQDRGVRVEELVLPDDVHDPLLWRNWTRTAAATADFFERMLK
jgi:dipeptidyl aminopeptidase/acylaminoacyl peptidase